MKKDKWLGKSINERLQWYSKKFAELNESLSSGKPADHSREQLQEIKKRMVFDGTPSESRMNNGDESQKKYYESVYKAYKSLPNMNTDISEWSKELVRAKELLKIKKC